MSHGRLAVVVVVVVVQVARNVRLLPAYTLKDRQLHR